MENDSWPGVVPNNPAGTATSPREDSLCNRAVLVVDDDADSREWLRVCLEADGYRVLLAASGKEALERVAEYRPDLILMDVLMPGMDGFEATRRLKRFLGTRAVPVIMVTRLNDRAARLEGLDAGAEDFLSKPLDPVELSVRVRNLLRIKCYNDLLLQENRSLEQDVLRNTQLVRQHCIDTVMTLTRAAEYRDEQTGNHINRIRYYTAALADHMGLGSEFCEQIFYASPMHDIGKLAIPDHILLKPGGFTAQEWEVMKTHTRRGWDILDGHSSPYLNMGKDIARFHHECWDGSGYPEGLAGDAIPLSSRIMAICDVYDALRSARPYKAALDHGAAVRIIQEGDARTRPENFDPHVLTAFGDIEARFHDIYAEYSQPHAQAGAD